MLEFDFDHTVKTSKTITVPDGVYYMRNFDDVYENAHIKLIVSNDGSKIKYVRVSVNDSKLSIHIDRDAYELPYSIESVFAYLPKTEFTTKEIFNNFLKSNESFFDADWLIKQ